MNVDYILTEEYLKLNGVNIYLGDSFSEIESKANLEMSISQKISESCIVSEKDFQLHFQFDKLFMWVLIPDESYVNYKSDRMFLRNVDFLSFLDILYSRNIQWNFKQELTFLDQVCIQLANKVDFIFGFDEDTRKGIIVKIGFYSMNLLSEK